jgi:hypothetical protein
MEIQKYVEQYFAQKYIPFKKNIVCRGKSETFTEFDIILPNTLVEVKGGLYDNVNCHYFNKLVNQIKRMIKYVPDGVNIWIYFHMEQSSIVYEMLSKYDRINVTHNLDDIHIDMSEYVLYTESTGVLRSLAAKDYCDRFHINNIYGQITVNRNVYYRAIANMPIEEMELLNKIDMCFTDVRPPYSIDVVHNISPLRRYINKDKIDTIWKVFEITVPKFTINIAYKIILFDGVTACCEKCRIVRYITDLRGGLCSHCR